MSIQRDAWNILEYLDDPATYKGNDQDIAYCQWLNSVYQLCLDIVEIKPVIATIYDQ